MADQEMSEGDGMQRPVMPSQSMWTAGQIATTLPRGRWYSSFTNQTIILDEAARKGLILRRIRWWCDAVELQHKRLTTTERDRDTRSDLNFYILAAQNLVDAVRVIHSQYPEQRKVRSIVDRALNRFHAACPDLEVLRDIIEHSDAYDHREGDMQVGKGKGKRVSPPDLLPKWRAGQFENYSLTDGDAELTIFNKRLIVSTTTPAARYLTETVLALKDELPG